MGLLEKIKNTSALEDARTEPRCPIPSPSPSDTHRFGQRGAWQGWKFSYAGSLGCCVDPQIHSWDCCGRLGRGRRKASRHLPLAWGTRCLVRLASASPCTPQGTAQSRCPGVPPHPAPPTHTAEDWGPKLNLLGPDQASFNHPHFLPVLNPTPPPPAPSRTSPAPGLARLPFLKPWNQKSQSKSPPSAPLLCRQSWGGCTPPAEILPPPRPRGAGSWLGGQAG